jgi:hypothetical protein
MESLAFVPDDHPLERKRYFGNAIRTILPMQTIFDPHTPSSLRIKFREMIVKGGATNLGTIFSNTNMRMSKQTFPNSYIPKGTTFPKARQRAQSEPRIPNGL